MKSFYFLLVIIFLISLFNFNYAKTDIKIESFSTTPSETATSSNGKCSGIEASFTLTERPADFSNVSVYVTGVASKSLQIKVDSSGKTYTLSGIELYPGSTLSFGNFNIKINDDAVSLDEGVSSPTLTCSTSNSNGNGNSESVDSSINPPNLNEDPPTKVTAISTANSYDVAKDGICSQVSISFTIDKIADPTTLSITSQSIDTTTNTVKITQPDVTIPNYVADFDVKEETTLDDISISFDGTPLTIASKLSFECKKSVDSSESSLLSINIVLILSSLFLYIVLFN